MIIQAKPIYMYIPDKKITLIDPVDSRFAFSHESFYFGKFLRCIFGSIPQSGRSTQKLLVAVGLCICVQFRRSKIFKRADRSVYSPDRA